MGMDFDFAENGAIQIENMDQLVVSELETEVFTFAWKVKTFPQPLARDFISPVFTSRTGKTLWSVILERRSEIEGLPKSAGSYIYISLRLLETKRNFPLNTHFRSYIVDSENKPMRGPINMNHKYAKVEKSPGLLLSTEATFMNLAQGFLSADGSLNLCVQIKTTAREHHDQTPFKNHKESQAMVVQRPFRSFLENGHFSDVTLLTKMGSFPASKIVLAGQSPVFTAMFLSEMLESKENVVKIEDFSDETVKGFLEFLYTGESDSLKENSVELLKISEKYEVLPLKMECEKILMKELNKENAVELIVLGSFYNSPKLKTTAVTFIKKFRKEVAQTESFKQLKKRHPEILLDLYSEFDKN